MKTPFLKGFVGRSCTVARSRIAVPVMADEAGRVAADTRVRGTVRGTGAFVVAGQVEGQVILQDEAVVEPGGQIRGKLEARAVSSSGRVEGTVATGRLEVRSAATVAADLTATTVVVEEGASVQGYLHMPLDLPSGLEE